MSAPVSVVTPRSVSDATSAKRSAAADASSLSPDSRGLSVYQSSLTSPDILEATRQTSRLRAMRSGVLTSTRLIEEQLAGQARTYRPALVTLTYARPGEWKSEHVSQLIACYREWLRRRGFPMFYVWVMEIQEKRYLEYGDAVPHYHILLWLPQGVDAPLPDERGWWPHGMTRSEWVLVPLGITQYLCKYLSKGGLLHLFPPRARIWGAGGLSAASLAKRKFLRLPQYLREVIALPGEVLRCVRIAGRGWWVPGKCLWLHRSPWRVDRYSWSRVFLMYVGWQPGDIEDRSREVFDRGQWFGVDPSGALC